MIALLLVILLYGFLALVGAVVGFMASGGDASSAAWISAAATALLIVFSGFFTSHKD